MLKTGVDRNLTPLSGLSFRVSVGFECFVLLEGGGSKETETPGARPEHQTHSPEAERFPQNEMLQS